MRKKISVVLLVISILTLVPVFSVQAVEPLIGTMDLQFNLEWPGPQEKIPDWIGYITIDGKTYGMVFFNIGTGKPDNHNPGGNVVFFGEIWVIYEWIKFKFNSVGGIRHWKHGPVILQGTDEGIVSVMNDNYHMNGVVTVAKNPFSKWLGRNVYMSGDIIWLSPGIPLYAPGTFRIN